MTSLTNETHIKIIAQELGLKLNQVQATATLLADSGTVPFIARYRKEATGTLDEVAITSIRDRLTQLTELDSRRKSILASLDERKLTTPELKAAIDAAETLTKLEDIYQPYRPKRRTKATIAKEKGLEPLAQLILEQQEIDPASEAAKYINPEKEVEDTEQALAGARDIIAEFISDHATARQEARDLYLKESVVKSEVIKSKETEGAKFRDYFEWQEPISQAPSHRILAIRRGEKEGFLFTRTQPDQDAAISILKRLFVKGNGPAAAQVSLAAEDCYKRLFGPSLETETRVFYKKKADEEAIKVFAKNLRELLLASPLGQKPVMAIDPGFRTGCKVVCLDAQGKLLHHDVIYIGQSARAEQEAEVKISAACKDFSIEAIAIGNGTASREAEAFVRKLGLPSKIAVVVVNESGASIYSASEVAREEFPNEDITVRGSVSIGRRLMDPLAELVKLDAKSIGVGQYQHDVNQNHLKASLDDVVISCVNGVGVEVNTASKQLLSYVSGFNETIAGNIVAHRNENGPFKSKAELSKVSRLGPKAYEQAAGFLRIRDAQNPLDSSAVHPERYATVEKMAKDVGADVSTLIKDNNLRQKIDLEHYVTDDMGLPTLKDIMDELTKPGRDPRKQFEAFQFKDGVEKIEDLEIGMKLPGIVTNVTAFGAFVDVGVHQDGLVHISQLSDSFVKDPAEVVKVQQKVNVTVTEIDVARKRVGLSMKTVVEPQAQGIGKSAQGKTNSNNRGMGSPRNKNHQKKGHSKHKASQSLTGDWFSDALKKGK